MQLIPTASHVLVMTIVVSTTVLAGSKWVQNAGRDDGVYVVGALHRLHEQEESFRFDELGQLDGHLLLQQPRRAVRDVLRCDSEERQRLHR